MATFQTNIQRVPGIVLLPGLSAGQGVHLLILKHRKEAGIRRIGGRINVRFNCAGTKSSNSVCN